MHHYDVRVFFEDTDAAGIVYHANYLKFAERARSTLLAEHGFYQSKMKQEYGVMFIIKEAILTMHKPAYLDDLLNVRTMIKARSKLSFFAEQTIEKPATETTPSHLIAHVRTLIVCIDTTQFRPTKIPGAILDCIAQEAHAHSTLS